MPLLNRSLLLVLFLGLALGGCGRTIQEEVSDSVTDAIEEEQALEEGEEEDVGEFAHLRELMNTFRGSANQAELETNIAEAQAEGFSDEDISSALGLAHFWTPGRRVLISVAYVRFKARSETPAATLDEAFEYASTAPWLRDDDEDAEEEEETEEEETEEDDEPRRNGWFGWIPGL